MLSTSVYPLGQDRSPAWFTSEARRGPRARNQDLWRRADLLLENDRVARRITEELTRKKKRLRLLAPEPAWRAFLEVEELELRRTLRWLELAFGSEPPRRRKR